MMKTTRYLNILLIALTGLLVVACADMSDRETTASNGEEPAYVEPIHDKTDGANQRIANNSEIHLGMQGCGLEVNYIRPNPGLAAGTYLVEVEVPEATKKGEIRPMTWTLSKEGTPRSVFQEQEVINDMYFHRYFFWRNGGGKLGIENVLVIGFLPRGSINPTIPSNWTPGLSFDLEGAVQCLIHNKTLTLEAPRSIAAGFSHSLAINAKGNVEGWGENGSSFRLGTATRPHAKNPQETGLKDAIAVAAGSHHSMVLTAKGEVFSVGKDSEGQLGDGDIVSHRAPDAVQAKVENVHKIAAGGNHSLALTRDGKVWSWGENNEKQLGRSAGGMSATPDEVPGLDNVIDIAAGSAFSLALKANGTVWAWGENGNHQLGNGSQTRTGTPTQVKNLSDVIAIAAGEDHALALKADGTVWGWGDNGFGESGQNASDGKIPTPLEIPLEMNVKAIAAGNAFSLVITEDDRVGGWGKNEANVLGFSSGGSTFQPNLTPKGVKIEAIAAGDGHALALDSECNVWSWGKDDQHQLGDGIRGNGVTPKNVFSCQ